MHAYAYGKTNRPVQCSCFCMSRRFVSMGNELAIKVSFLCTFGWVNDVGYAIEQPISSLLPKFPCIQRLFAHTRVSITAADLGAYGAATVKPVRFFHSSSWVNSLCLKQKRACKSVAGQTKVTLVKRTCSKSGRPQITGLKVQLKGSQVYPVAFGQAAAHAKAKQDSARREKYYESRAV
eukprot:4287037-Amphidinium_carterae.2